MIHILGLNDILDLFEDQNLDQEINPISLLTPVSDPVGNRVNNQLEAASKQNKTISYNNIVW